MHKDKILELEKEMEFEDDSIAQGYAFRNWRKSESERNTRILKENDKRREANSSFKSVDRSGV